MKSFLLTATIFVAFASATPNNNVRKTTFPAEKIKAHTILDVYANTIGSGRIISGLPAEVGQFPWQIGMIATGAGGSFICGGSLITDEWILTAAHCIIDMTSFTIHLGGLTLNNNEVGKTIRTATEYIAHPDYNAFFNNDIGLIRLDEPIEFSDRIQPVRLPPRDVSVQPQRSLVVSGWGKTSDASNTASPTLQWTQVTAISNAECSSIYAAGFVVDTTLCTVGNPNNGTCSGDSGGPLVWFDENGDAIQEGVVSFGADNACEAGYPAGFVRTSSMLDWIVENAGLDL